LFKPKTVLRWQRDLVARKWMFKRRNRGGRPRTDPALEQLVVRLARENLRWGYAKIHGELLKLSHRVGKPPLRPFCCVTASYLLLNAPGQAAGDS
jgi:putative transposase